ncbi:MAG: ABC transporter ATP-binding protein [Oscillospiraceae bacterium]
MENNVLVRLDNCSIAFDGETILNNLSLDIHDEEFVTLLGPSGCGKTTTLRFIGGFLIPDSGRVFFDGKDVTHVPPYKREVNTVFQRYALFPHLNVFENIAFGLRLKKTPESEIKASVAEMIELVNLRGFESRRIGAMSGGQQQRVAIARALVNKPRILLLDEPLGALDLKLRKDMQVELKRIQQQLDITFVYVTHDQEEALTMSDTVVVMNGGIIQQIGTPEDIYNEPKNAFIADFIGESNIIEGIMHDDYLVQFAGEKFKCVDSGFAKDEFVDVVVRPEDIQLVTLNKSDLWGVVKSVVFKGVHFEMLIEQAGYTWKVHSTQSAEPGTQVGMKIGPDEIHIMKRPEE